MVLEIVIYGIICFALGTKAFLRVKYLDLISKLHITVNVPDLLASSGKMTDCQDLIVFSRMYFGLRVFPRVCCLEIGSETSELCL